MKVLITIAILWAGALACQAQSSRACMVYGKIFITDKPAEADIRVYMADSEAFADLRVYRIENLSYADRPGIWYLVERAQLSDYTVMVVSTPAMADFTIYYIENEYSAGCNQ